MKKSYNTPCLQVVLVLGKDIMTGSNDPYMLNANDFTQGDIVQFGQLPTNP